MGTAHLHKQNTNRPTKHLSPHFCIPIHLPFNHHKIISKFNWWLLNSGSILRRVLWTSMKLDLLLRGVCSPQLQTGSDQKRERCLGFLFGFCVFQDHLKKKTSLADVLEKHLQDERKKKQHGATNARLAAGFSTSAIRGATRWQRRPRKEDWITGATNSESPTSGGSANEALSSAGQIQTETGVGMDTPAGQN